MSETTLRDFGDYKLHLLRKDRGLSRTLQKPDGHKNREKGFMWVMRKVVERNDVCFDIGANIGFTTVNLAMLSDRPLYAVEPVLLTFMTLMRNMELNDVQGAWYRMALSNETRPGEIRVAKSLNVSGLSSKIKGEPQKVPVMSMADFYERYVHEEHRPTYFKMDIEGHEIEVLQGMLRELADTPRAKIQIEVHPRLYDNPDRMADVLRELQKLGFGCRYLVSAAVARPDMIKAKGYEPIKVFDTSGWQRGVYENVNMDDAINFSSYPHEQFCSRRQRTSKKIVRSVLLEKKDG